MIAAPYPPPFPNPALTWAATPGHSFGVGFWGWGEDMPKFGGANARRDIDGISTASRVGGVEPPGIHGRDARPAPGRSEGGAWCAAVSPNFDE